MYLSFDTGKELTTALIDEKLESDEYWLILLSEQSQHLLEPIIRDLSENKVRFLGAVFPGLIYGKRTFHSGAIIRRVKCLSPPVCVSLPTSDRVLQSTLISKTKLQGRAHKATCLIFVDCLSRDIDGLLGNLFEEYQGTSSFFGAGAGNSKLENSLCVFGEWGSSSESALIAFIDQESNCQAQHGWSKSIGPLVATETTHNILHTLNYNNAEQSYRSILPKNLSNAPPEYLYKEVSPHFPFAVEHADSNDIVVRDPIAITRRGDITFLSDIPQGASLYLVEGTPESLIKAAKTAVESTVNLSTESVLVCNCLSRTVSLGSKFPEELREVHEELYKQNDQLNVEGVLALGEIASNGSSRISFFNKTFGICAFQNHSITKSK